MNIWMPKRASSKGVSMSKEKGSRNDAMTVEKQAPCGTAVDGQRPKNKFNTSGNRGNAVVVELMIDDRPNASKPKGAAVGAIRSRLKPVMMNASDMYAALERGCTVMPAVCDGGTTADDWCRQQLFFFDFDNKPGGDEGVSQHLVSPEEVIERLVSYGVRSGFCQESWSSTEDRVAFHVGFMFDEPVTDRETAANVVAGLLRAFPEADQRCRDVSRMFYGSRHEVRCWNEGLVASPTELLAKLPAMPTGQASESEPLGLADGALARAKASYDLLGLIRADVGDSGVDRGGIVYFAGACPICGHQDCFRFYPQTNTWHCFGASGDCGGSAIDYLMRTRSMSERGAIREVLGISLGEAESNDSEHELPTGAVNAILQCMADSGIDEHIGFDVRESRPYARRGLPWNRSDDRPWGDYDAAKLRQLMQEQGIKFTNPDLKAAFAIACHENQFDPFREALEALPEWDGIQRCGSLIGWFLGAEEDAYTYFVERLIFDAILARTYETDVKFDFMPVLFGRQGIGKSTLAKMLALSPRFFTDALRGVGERTGDEIIQGRVIVEVAELAAMEKRSLDTIKAFISRAYDDYRAPYAHFVTRHPRRCVLVASTNSDSFLSDESGNRRFLPIACGVNEPKMDLFSPDAVGVFTQAWAEALRDYRQKGACLVLPPEIVAIAAEKQDAATQEDPRVEMIREWLLRSKRIGDFVASQEALELALGVPRANQKRGSVSEVRTLLLNYFPELKALPKKKSMGQYGVVRVFAVVSPE